MKEMIIFFVKVLLIFAAVVILIYNIYIGERIAYLSSGIAVVGTVALLVQDIRKRKRDSDLTNR